MKQSKNPDELTNQMIKSFLKNGTEMEAVNLVLSLGGTLKRIVDYFTENLTSTEKLRKLPLDIQYMMVHGGQIVCCLVDRINGRPRNEQPTLIFFDSEEDSIRSFIERYKWLVRTLHEDFEKEEKEEKK